MNIAGWRRGCGVIVAAFLAALLLACPTGVAGVWNGAIGPPRFDGRLGSWRVVGYRTWNRNCPPFVGCDPTTHESYVVWLMVDPQERDRAGGSAYRIVRLPIEHRP